jgi:glutamine synthetase
VEDGTHKPLGRILGARQLTRSLSNSADVLKGSVVPKGMLTVAELKELARLDKIDTVVVGITDCYGRLVGKRYTADFFLESAVDDGTHACSYLLATDMNMEPVPGYKYANWEAGYGDIHLVPDLKTLRVASWWVG